MWLASKVSENAWYTDVWVGINRKPDPNNGAVRKWYWDVTGEEWTGAAGQVSVYLITC